MGSEHHNDIIFSSGNKTYRNLTPLNQTNHHYSHTRESDMFYASKLHSEGHGQSDQTYMKQLYTNSTNPLLCQDEIYDRRQYNEYQDHTYSEPMQLPYPDNEFDSQIPGTQLCNIIDRDLANLPRDLYISKLLKLTNQCDNELNAYRNILFQRATQLDGCPKGRLIVRRGSKRNPAYHLLASDCFILNMFLLGDQSTEIESIFSKAKNLNFSNVKPESTHSPCRESSPIHPIDYQMEMSRILSNVIEINNKYNEITNDIMKDREEICHLKQEIVQLQTDNETLKAQVISFENDVVNRINDSETKVNSVLQSSIKEIKTNSKQIDQACKTIADISVSCNDDSNLTNNQTIVNTVTSNSIQQNKTKPPETSAPVYQTQKDVPPENVDKDLPKATQLQSYADVVKNTQNSTQKTDNKTNKQPIVFNEQSRTWMRPSSVQQSQKQGNNRNPNGNQPSVSSVAAPEQPFSAPRQTIKQPEIFPIKSHVSNVYSRQSYCTNDTFSGVYTGKLKNYYISGIDPMSTHRGLESYLYLRGVTAIELSLFENKKGALVAKLSIPYYQGKIIENDDSFWPQFTRCRRWYSNNAWSNLKSSFQQKKSHRNEYNYAGKSNNYYGPQSDID